MPLDRVSGQLFAIRFGHDDRLVARLSARPHLRGSARRRTMRPGPRSVLAGMLASLLISMTLAVDHAHAQAKPIRIGEINSYSGVATVFTFPYKEGLALATKEINDAGGVLGRPLEFIHRDDKLKPDEAVKAARELVLQEKVDFLAGCITSAVGLAISAYAQEAKA